MAEPYRDDVPMHYIEDQQTRHSLSLSSMSSTSAILENLGIDEHAVDGMATSGHADGYLQSKVPLMQGEQGHRGRIDGGDGDDGDGEDDDGYDAEKMYRYRATGPSRNTKRVIWVVSAFALGGWLLALFFFLRNGTRVHVGDVPFAHHDDPDKAGSKVSTGAGSGKALDFDQVLDGMWYGRTQSIKWIASPDGKDGMMLERHPGTGTEALVLEDVRGLQSHVDKASGRVVLVESGNFRVDGRFVMSEDYWPSPDTKKVLIVSDKESTWRHSFIGVYWILDVATQRLEPLDADMVEGRVQLAQWSPTSDSIVFTRNNNLFIRHLDSKEVKQITKDGGPNFFYGIPDWVYEEEVFEDRIGTWFSRDGKHVAFLQTNETAVPEYKLQYYIKRPNGNDTPPGEENYPDETLIKYPKAGAPNPVVKMQFFSLGDGKSFEVNIDNDLPDHDRLITEVVWGEDGRVLIRETNRVSDLLKVVVVDVNARSGRVVRETDVAKLDGGWFEVSETTTFVPSDPQRGRPSAGYIDTVIADGYDHLAYFTPLDNPEPIMLTSGKWEVVSAPSSVDLEKNLVYFVATKQGPATRHVYSVGLDGKDLKPLPGVDEHTDAFWDVSFSAGSGFALLNYRGPGIPTQKIVATPSNAESPDFAVELQNNDELRKMAAEHDLPERTYSTVTSDGTEVAVLELRPPHFDESRQYPVLLAPYGGPNSQQVDKQWRIGFEAYLAATLGYVVLVVDNRGTGWQGRAYRCAVRGRLGELEARDQIAAARHWAATRRWVDAARMAVWGWSYGGFLTLKTLELDAGATFSYGMAVAPVTDWRYYDSVYTERYMNTPAANRAGYDAATVSNVTALAQNTRFLVMHGTADDNVHLQNSLVLLDKLDLASIHNYDFHAFPDSDHSIYFHNARKVVYRRLRDWLVNAFNGEFHELNDPTPHRNIDIE